MIPEVNNVSIVTRIQCRYAHRRDRTGIPQACDASYVRASTQSTMPSTIDANPVPQATPGTPPKMSVRSIAHQIRCTISPPKPVNISVRLGNSII